MDNREKIKGRSLSLRRSVILSALCAAAMVLSYIESLIPPLVAIPGVKLGLANTVSVFALYSLDKRAAVCVSALRVSLSALLFGNAVGFIYSLSGAALSLLCMILISKLRVFSVIGVSIASAVAHNVGQVIAAAIVMSTWGVLLYIAPLLVSGSLAGAAVGALGGALITKIRKPLRAYIEK